MQSLTIDLHGSRNRFLDALKGYAILFVLINHGTPLYLKQWALFDLWGGMAVPLFLVIQVFNYLKMGGGNLRQIKWKRILRKLVCPFVVAEALIVIIKSFADQIPLTVCAAACITKGGFGPGEYYIWQYFQFLFLCPIVWLLLYRKFSKKVSCLIAILVSIGFELLASILSIPEHTYKFLFFRYFFLTYIGFLWAMNDVVLNRMSLFLSCISITAIMVFDYSTIDLSPFFYASSWKCFHWISYFYVASLLVFVIHFIHKRLGKSIQAIVEEIGRNSWIIFCTQIVVYYFLSPASFSFFIDSATLRGAMYFFSGITVSIVPVLIVRRFITYP